MIYLKLPKLLEDLCQFSIIEVRQKDILFGEWKDYVTELASNNTIYGKKIYLLQFISNIYL